MAGRRPLTITWYGHSAFLLAADDGRTVLVDPWLDNPKSPLKSADLPAPGLILITHGHDDHLGNVVDIARRRAVPVIAGHEVALFLESQGLDHVTGMGKGGTVEEGGVSVTMTHAVHSGDIDILGAGRVIPGGEPAGFVVAFPGHPKVYHAGDTDVFGDMALIRELHAPEIAILPIGGRFTMGPRAAALAVRLLSPETVIGMHYGTYPKLAGTPDELRSHLEPARRGIVAELVPGVAARFA